MELLDILEYSIRSMLMLYLCSGMISWKKVFKKQGKFLFFLLFVAVSFWINYSVWIQKMIYKDGILLEDSARTILKLLFLGLFYFLLLDIFYQGSRLIKFYLVLLYEVIFEMARFCIFGFWYFGIDLWIERYTKYSLQGTTQGRYLTGGVPPVRFSM